MTEPNGLQNRDDYLPTIQRLMREIIGELAPHCQFIVLFLVAMLAERTVSLAWIATVLSPTATEESNRKRIQRFLEDTRVTPESFATLIAKFLPTSSWILVVDRTNWFWGKSPINLLVLAVLYNGAATPLFWMNLERNGASDTAQRIELIQKFLDLFGAIKINYVTGDREFIGADWIQWLDKRKISYRLRLRQTDQVTDRRGRVFKVADLFTRSHKCRKGQFLLWGTLVYLGGKPHFDGDFLIIASSQAGNLMEDYRNRWSIECLFQALKGRGFHLEETRVVEPVRLCRLFGLLSLAYVVCVHLGQSVAEVICKSTGRLRRSVARRGLQIAHRIALYLVGPPTERQLQQFLQVLTSCKT
jgi:Transposase DDE domain